MGQPNKDFFQNSLPNVVEVALINDVVPLIVEGCRLTLNAYDLDPHFNDNFMIGTYSWRNIFNRCMSLDQNIWHVYSNENDLRILYKPFSSFAEFRVHRCESGSRVPTGGKRAKKAACGQAFLSQEIENMSIAKSYLVIGYDIDEIRGLGLITVDRLNALNDSEFSARTLSVLYDSEIIDENISYKGFPEPERFDIAMPKRDTSKIDVAK